MKLKAIDAASSVINRLNKNISNLGAGGVAIGNLLSSSILGAVGIASNAVSSLANAIGTQFQEALKTEQSLLLTSSGFADALRIPLSEAQGLVTGLGGELEKLANQLPGNSSEYSELFRLVSDDILRAQKDLDGANFAFEGFEDTIKTLVPRLSILANESGVAAAAAARTITKTLGGTQTWAQLVRDDLFQKNPLLQNAIEEQLTILGRDINDLTEGQILQVLERASVEALPDSYLDAARQTVDAKIQNFYGAWFSPITGALSIFRDLDPKIAGSQSVYTSIGQTYADFLYSLQSAGQIFSTLTGIEDPMKALDSAVRSFDRNFMAPVARVLASLSKIESPVKLQSILSGVGGNLFIDFQETLKQGIVNLLDNLPNWINNFWDFFQTIDWEGLGSQVGGKAADVFNKLVEALGRIDFLNAIQGLWGYVKGIIKGIQVFFANIDYGQLLGVLWNTFTELFSGALIVLGEGFQIMVQNLLLPFQAVGWATGEALTGMWNNQFGQVFGMLSEAILDTFIPTRQGIKLVEFTWTDGFDDVVNTLKNSIGKILDWARGFVDWILPGDQSSSLSISSSSGSNKMLGVKPDPSSASLTPVSSNSKAQVSLGDRLSVAPNIRQAPGGFTVNGGIHLHGVNTNDPEKLADDVLKHMARQYNSYKYSVQSTGPR